MPDTIQTQVAILATKLEGLTEAIHAERDATDKFREAVLSRQEEMSKQMASMKTTLDMAKGGWAVLALAGAGIVGFVGLFTNLFKFMHA